MAKIKIMVVDDQQLVRIGLVRLLDDMPDFTVVGSADCGEQALEKIGALSEQGAIPDVVLMDLRMPGIGGLETTRKLLRRFPQIKVVAVTACDAQPFPQRFIESGATAFVTKDADIGEVVQAIRTAAVGRRYLSQKIAQDMALTVLETRDENNALSPFELLSERELQIAMMVMKGIKTNDMAEKLVLSPKSVNTYRYRMFDKLKVRSNMELALLATRHGILEVHDRK